MNASKCLLPTTTQPLARKSFTKTQPRPSPSCIPRATPTALLAVPCRSHSGFNPSKCRRGISSRTSTATSRVAAHATPELAPLWRVSESSDDLLVSVLFVVATLTLFGLTAGVAYLSFTSWFDDRQERQDRENFENRDKYDEQMNKFRKSGAKKATKEKPVRRATPKGFGKE
ncbi:hypothetical protein BSKO_11899 [Bryopsis sp. KO-2023]|nr:hypothetical protein BSKO_11899 [Bryopsis sp. KO-2023]